MVYQHTPFSQVKSERKTQNLRDGGEEYSTGGIMLFIHHINRIWSNIPPSSSMRSSYNMLQETAAVALRHFLVFIKYEAESL